MSKIPKIYKYGIEITKPWSKEMYEFNELLSQIMIDDIQSLIENLDNEESANTLAGIINPYTYGEGYDLDRMKRDMLDNTETFEKWWLDEIWSELLDKGYLTPIVDELNQDLRIIGFEDKEEIKFLREVYGALNSE